MKLSFYISDSHQSLSKNEVVAEVKRRIKEPEFKPSIWNNPIIKLSAKFISSKKSNNFYQLADGLLIGPSSSTCFADTYIQPCENISIHNVIHTPRIWLSKVGDTFAITHHDKINILAELNKIHGNIKLKVEDEVSKAMLLLDSLISRANENQLKTSVYR